MIRRRLAVLAAAVAASLGIATAAYAAGPVGGQSVSIPGISLTSFSGGSGYFEIEYDINPNGGPTVSYVEFCDSPSVGVFQNCQFLEEESDGHGTSDVTHDLVMNAVGGQYYSFSVEAVNQGGRNYTSHGRIYMQP